MLLSDVWCLSVAYIGRNSRTERPRKTKISTDHAREPTRDSDTTFKVKRSKVKRSGLPGRFTQRGLNAQGGCSGHRWNVFGVGKYCYVASASSAAREAPGCPQGGEGRGIMCRHAHSLYRITLVRAMLRQVQICRKSLTCHWDIVGH